MKKLVIKIGSSFFINDRGEINKKNILELIKQISIIKQKGVSCCLISSGAIAVGVKKMGYSVKHANIAKKQACAAIGQMFLMQEYEQVFSLFDLQCAQILLNHDDFGNRKRIISLKNTIEKLFSMNVVPVINENDALAVDEIKVGDNDTLSAMVSLVLDADMLILVSDVDGLYSANPKHNPDAKLLKEIDDITDDIRAMAGGAGTVYGTGGMSTKIKAGEIAVNSGIPMMIVNKTKIDHLSTVADGQNIGSLFKGKKEHLDLKESWIKYCANIDGKIVVDDGAKKAVKNRKSLLNCGIVSVSGQFRRGEVVELSDENGNIFAKGVTLFDFSELKKIPDLKKSKEIAIHANNIVILEK